MAKRRNSHQLPLEKRNIPKMPEGYYSSGPNPNLRRFVEQHSTPYDPATDTYDVPPFDQPITTTKATAIYNMHTYWSKKPHDAIRQYIRHYTQPGDLVLDPFCGSGGTALAALMEGRKAIAIDLSPAATFITKNYCTPVDVGQLQGAFETLQAKVKAEMDWLYETRCDRCDGRATTAYTVYSQVFRCERCLNDVPLFDCVEVEGETAQGKPRTLNACPYCYEAGTVEEISTRSNKKLGSIPVLVAYKCLDGCNPQRDVRCHNDGDDKKRDYFHRYDVAKLEEIESKKLPYWTPSIPMIKGYETTVKRNLEAQGVHLVDDMFSKRNLWALSLLHKAAISSELPDVFLFALTGICLAVSRMQRYSPSSTFPNMVLTGTYYIPPVGREHNVADWYEGKIDGLMKGYRILDLASTELVVSTNSAVRLDIGSETVDHIFTDPPYAGKIQYGELNYVWEAWLNFDTSWLNNEIIVNSIRNKTDEDWKASMLEAMKECFRILKPNRWISLCYHDTSEGTWQLVQDIMAEVGFIADNTDTTLFIDAGQKSYNQLIAGNVTKRDLVINFRKPRPGEVVGITLTGDEDARTFTEKAQAVLRDALHKHPGSSADRLYDELVSRMVRRGEFERHNFDALLRGIAEESDGRWYLLETADQIDEAESRKEDAAAARLETFMKRTIDPRQGITGVHYSDLFEQYLPVKDKPRRELRDWLREYFYETGEGTWRLPNDDEERENKRKLRQSGLLRRVKRFANALIEGVPPAQRDQPESAATAAEWLRQCRRAGLFEQGRAIWEKGGFNWNSLPETQYIEAEEDYQRCVRRGSLR